MSSTNKDIEQQNITHPDESSTLEHSFIRNTDSITATPNFTSFSRYDHEKVFETSNDSLGSLSYLPSSEKRLSHRLGWEKGDEESGSREEQSSQNDLKTSQVSLESKIFSHENDTVKMVHEMLQAPLKRRWPKDIYSTTEHEIIPSKYGGFQYGPKMSSDTLSKFFQMQENRDIVEVDLRSSVSKNDKDSSSEHFNDEESINPSCLHYPFAMKFISTILVVLLGATVCVVSFIFGFKINENIKMNRSTVVTTSAHSNSLTELLKNTQLKLPSAFDNFVDVITPYNSDTEIPYFFHVPTTAGVMVESILGACYGCVQASSFWAKDFDHTEPLRILSRNSLHFVNVDTDSADDMVRAVNLGLTDSNLIDIVSSSQIHISSSLFTPERKGRMFMLMKNPVERVAQTYLLLSKHNQEVTQMTLYEFTKSRFISSDWMTRNLINKKKGSLTLDDLKLAKEILRRKTVIGLVDQIHESLNRFVRYFDFKGTNESETSNCEQRYISSALDLNDDPVILQEGSLEWNSILQHNTFDMELYIYSLQLFEEQGVILKHGFF